MMVHKKLDLPIFKFLLTIFLFNFFNLVYCQVEEDNFNLTYYNNWPDEHHPKKTKVHSIDSIIIKAPITTVWKWLEKPGYYPLWYKYWSKVIMDKNQDQEIKNGVLFKTKVKGLKVPTLVVDFQPMSEIAWRGGKFGTRGYHAWLLYEENGYTKVVTEETLIGLIPNILSKNVKKQVDKMHRHWLLQLKKMSEYGSPNDIDVSEISTIAYESKFND